MKKFLSKAAVVLITAGSITFGGSAAAMADDTSADVCVPVAAWTETFDPIDHSPVYDLVEHDAVIEIVKHPAVTEEIPHEAVYETVIITPAVPEVLEESYVEKQWKWWGYVGHGTTVWTDGSYPSAPANPYPGDWRLNGKERKVITQDYVAPVPAVTEERLVKEAWVEVKEVTPAWDEEVVVKEAWIEQKLIKEAWTETREPVEHAAVVCPEPEKPVVEAPTVVEQKPAAKAAVTAESTDLAETGGDAPLFLLGGGLLAVLAGGYLVARRVIPAKNDE